MGRSRHRFQRGSAKGGKNRLNCKMYFVYIIKSLVVIRYYIGSTENLDRRLSAHNLGKVKSTKAYKPWELVYTERLIQSQRLWKEKDKLNPTKVGTHLKNYLTCEYWRGARVVEWGGLENRCPACGTESSNLSLSAEFYAF